MHLDAAVDTEACPLGLAPTASTTAALALGDALALALLDARGFSAEDFARSHPGGALGRRLLTRVADVMRTGDALPGHRLTATLADAIVEMSRKGMGMTVVVDADGRVAGIFTDGDLRRCLDRVRDVARGPRRRRDDAHAAHHRRGHDSPSTAWTSMEAAPKVSQLLVVDGERPAGRRAAPARPVPREDRLMPTDALARARRVRLLTCDVDGVLTDGRIYVDDHGHETKAFSALDGVGIGLLQRAGIVVAWITGSSAPAVTHRARRLNVDARRARRRGQARAVGGAARAARHWRRRTARTSATTCPTCRYSTRAASRSRCRTRRAAVREHAHYVTARDGGAGAVRELAELILAAQGRHLDHRSPPPRAA